MSIETSAKFAEVLVSPQYRTAVNEAFEESPEVFMEQRELAESIAVSALRKHRAHEHAAWEMRRMAAIENLGGDKLGEFSEYFQRQRGLAPEEGKEPHELEASNDEIVHTNSRILSLHQTFKDGGDPIDFIDAALTTIEERDKHSRRKHGQSVGPESYATTLKFFTDEIRDFPSQHLSRTVIREQVSRCMDGFEAIAERDQPNFIEMTNIYSAIRGLPEGSFEARFTPAILQRSFELLPDFDSGILSVMIASLSKLDLSENGEAAATLIDLAIRKGKKFETTRDYLSTLRAIGNLPPSAAANRAFATFGEYRNNLETSLDIDGCDVANEQLLKIVNGAVDDPGLSRGIRQLAELNARSAIRQLRAMHHSGELTQTGLQQVKATVDRIVMNTTKI